LKFDSRVSNNQDTRMILESGGNVGIGDTDPSYTLSVDGTASISDSFYVMDNLLEISNSSVSFGGTGSVSFAGDLDIEGDVNIGNDDLYIDASSGNIGIGTTSPVEVLHVGNLGASLEGIMFSYGVTSFRNSIGNKMDAGDITGNKMTFKVCDKTATGQTTVMTLLGNGNVGIGDTVPGYKLSVDGTASISGLTIFDNVLDVNGTASSTFAGDLDIEGDVNIGNDDLYIDASSGRIGIGETSPDAILHGLLH